MIVNPTHRAVWRKRAQKWSANAVAAKARKRMERGEEMPEEESATLPPRVKLKYATVTIRCGTESVSFRVYRFDVKRLMMRGRVQAPSTIGRRVALVLDSVL